MPVTKGLQLKSALVMACLQSLLQSAGFKEGDIVGVGVHVQPGNVWEYTLHPDRSADGLRSPKTVVSFYRNGVHLTTKNVSGQTASNEQRGLPFILT